MPEIPDVSPNEIIESEWGNDIRSRTAQRYVSATERDALVPVPTSGDLAWLEDLAVLQAFDGTEWQTIAELEDGPFLPLTAGSGKPLTGALYASGSNQIARFWNPTPDGDAFISFAQEEPGNSFRYGYIGGVGGEMRLQSVNGWPLMLQSASGEIRVASTARMWATTTATNGAPLIIGRTDSTNSPRIMFQRSGVPWWRFTVGTAGMLLQFAPEGGGTWTTVETWSPTLGALLPSGLPEIDAHASATPEGTPIRELLEDILSRLDALENP